MINFFKSWLLWAMLTVALGYIITLPLLSNCFYLTGGFILLIKGADFLVTGASKLAKHFGVSPLVIGLTVVAFGTSLPELAVSVLAAIQGNADISLGNVIGSNTANIGLILGITALLSPLTIAISTITIESPLMLMASFALLGLFGNSFWETSSEGFLLGRVDAIILLLLFAFFLWCISYTAKSQRDKKFQAEFQEEFGQDRQSLSKSIGQIVLGIVLVVGGAQLLIIAATAFARAAGLSDALIGLTLVAVGTSLPELVTSVVAGLKKEAGIAVGNIIGSNIFNILFILGIAGLLAPLKVSATLFAVDTLVMIIAALVLQFFMVAGRKLDRTKGALLLLGYFGYLFYLGKTAGVF
ncbi:calcium/sodium antiporter [Candidatus Woesearchaeota archaeon]|nr:calcium/sodium antiporter [Candidatus Woesearchaeota archaeon]